MKIKLKMITLPPLKVSKLNIEVLIQLYFNTHRVDETIKKYNEVTKSNLSEYLYSIFLKVLNFPTNSIAYSIKKKVDRGI